jgi:hypothetical protein
LQCWPIEIRASEAAIIVVLRNDGPAQMPLALDIDLGCFALRVQGVELLVESLFG